jgi:hypothetical protein
MRIYLWGAISNEVLGVSGYLVADKLNFGPRGRGDVKSEAVSRIAYLGGGAGHEDTKNHRFPRLTRIRKATKAQRHEKKAATAPRARKDTAPTAPGGESTEKKKFEIRSRKSETNPKFKCSNGQNEWESQVTQINRGYGREGSKDDGRERTKCRTTNNEL